MLPPSTPFKTAAAGDVLTLYEARDRLASHGVAALMAGRGALIKPWIFQEFREVRAVAERDLARSGAICRPGWDGMGRSAAHLWALVRHARALPLVCLQPCTLRPPAPPPLGPPAGARGLPGHPRCVRGRWRTRCSWPPCRQALPTHPCSRPMQGREVFLDTRERVGVYMQLVAHMKEHFRWEGL